MPVLHREGFPHVLLMFVLFHGWRKKRWTSYAESPPAMHAGLEGQIEKALVLELSSLQLGFLQHLGGLV